MKSVQIPDDLYKRAAELTARDQVSVDRLVATLVNERVSEWAQVQARAERGSTEKLRSVISRVSDAPAAADDQLQPFPCRIDQLLLLIRTPERR
jgi:predicted metalloprotease